MKSGGALELWSEYVRPIADPWCEPFVLAARYRVGPNFPWNGAPVAVELSWQSSPPLVQLLVGRTVLNFEDLPEETVWSEDDEIVLAPKGTRMNVFGGPLDIILNLEPAAFLVSASDMPEYRSAPTGGTTVALPNIQAMRDARSNQSIDTDVLAAGVARLWPAGHLQR